MSGLLSDSVSPLSPEYFALPKNGLVSVNYIFVHKTATFKFLLESIAR